jgi:hypothetical protein
MRRRRLGAMGQPIAHIIFQLHSVLVKKAQHVYRQRILRNNYACGCNGRPVNYLRPFRDVRRQRQCVEIVKYSRAVQPPSCTVFPRILLFKSCATLASRYTSQDILPFLVQSSPIMYFSACAVVVLLAGLAVMPLPVAAAVTHRQAKIGRRCTGTISSFSDVSAAEKCLTININKLGLPICFTVFSRCLMPVFAVTHANQIHRSRWQNLCNFCAYRCNNQPP